jgi:predicted GIY-YIG superfamily endonuclease
MEQHYCYVLKNKDINKNNSYCGYTNNPKRRIRQHNGELKGGAKATKGQSWDFMMLITGFPNSQKALSFEWKLKHPDGKRRKNKKYYGIEGRIKGLNELLDKIIRNEKENYTIYILEEAYQYIDFNMVPDNVKIEKEIHI